jgi:predicted ATPase
LFVGETLRLLALEHDSAETVGANLAIPPSLRDVIARRLAHLPDGCIRLLRSAAVLGREFQVDTLALVARSEPDEVLDTLDAAVEARVVSDVPSTDGRLRFSHVLIRDALYEGLTPARRMRLHRLAAHAIASIHGEASGPHLAELALHALAGRELDEGVSYAQRAGDRALTLLAYEEAARLYEIALAAHGAARPHDEPGRCEILLALGDARSRAGDSAGSKEIFLEAAAIARRRSTRDVGAKCVRGSASSG